MNVLELYVSMNLLKIESTSVKYIFAISSLGKHWQVFVSLSNWDWQKVKKGLTLPLLFTYLVKSAQKWLPTKIEKKSSQPI